MTKLTPVLGATYQSVLGSVLIALRAQNEKLITQTQVAEQVGVTVATWSRIERGVSALTVEQLLRATEFLGIPMSFLFAEVEAKVAAIQAQGFQVVASQDAMTEGNLLPLSSAQLSVIGGRKDGPSFEVQFPSGAFRKYSSKK